MRRQIACAAALLAFGTVLTGGGVAAADSAGPSGQVATKGAFKCEEWGRTGVTDRRTAVHVGLSSSSKVVGYLAKGERVKGYYRCTNSAGNIWYEITGDVENSPRFIWSGNV
ncbi:hypothetical protein [Streptomyces nanshensis]|uniref:SH3b domain-containing protein n=1 Tax=Streptomyces nanshensis TaxID=518642 RepID=A0A1E7L4M2_9ACTN|nr:hypothetical protein [Streptomyces nanshensis]OEV11130.1 hypothetical protein AN218_14445 [Streptomyces nanshensis]